MCGIFGFDKWTPYTERILGYGAMLVEQRGRQSWGLTNGRYLYKRPERIVGNFKVPKKIYTDKDRGVVVHTRAASVGEVSYENTHPFLVISKDQSRYVIGVHNGGISNYEKLGKESGFEHDVDSPHLFRWIADGRNTREVTGWGAIVWWEGPTQKNEKGELQYCWSEAKQYLARFNSENLAVAKLKTGEIVYGSTQDIVETAILAAGAKLSHFYKVEGDMKYFIDDGILREAGRMPFGGRAASAAQVAVTNGHAARYHYTGYETAQNRRGESVDHWIKRYEERQREQVPTENWKPMTSMGEPGGWSRQLGTCVCCLTEVVPKGSRICSKCKQFWLPVIAHELAEHQNIWTFTTKPKEDQDKGKMYVISSNREEARQTASSTPGSTNAAQGGTTGGSGSASAEQSTAVLCVGEVAQADGGN